ncbi:hypothetical protein OF83DRAFT_1179918 [Amylostereum chailletii]|nr:hypothetical protein OF83DRAFT_1179918 [Amylostereum chailletii]
MLLYCEDGMWKTDILFQAGYSQWAKNNGLKKSDASHGEVKDEATDMIMDGNSTVGMAVGGGKRRLSSSTAPWPSSRTKKIKPDDVSVKAPTSVVPMLVDASPVVQTNPVQASLPASPPRISDFPDSEDPFYATDATSILLSTAVTPLSNLRLPSNLSNTMSGASQSLHTPPEVTVAAAPSMLPDLHADSVAPPMMSSMSPALASIISDKQPSSAVETAANPSPSEPDITSKVRPSILSQVTTAANTATVPDPVQQIPLPPAFATVTRLPRQQPNAAAVQANSTIASQTATPFPITTSESMAVGPSHLDGSPSMQIPSESVSSSGAGKRGKIKADVKLSARYKPLTLSWQSMFAGRLLEHIRETPP